MKDRLVQKFVELDHAKTDRLLELHFKYMDKMDEADEDIAKTARMLANEGQAMDEEMIYIQKMELGLFTLQQVCSKRSKYHLNPILHYPVVKWDAPFRWLSIRCGPMGYSGKMVIRKTHRTVGFPSENKNVFRWIT